LFILDTITSFHTFPCYISFSQLLLFYFCLASIGFNLFSVLNQNFAFFNLNLIFLDMDPFFNIVSEHYQVPFRNELSNKYLFRFCYLTDDRCKKLSELPSLNKVLLLLLFPIFLALDVIITTSAHLGHYVLGNLGRCPRKPRTLCPRKPRTMS
jgi:hypothetical protein